MNTQFKDELSLRQIIIDGITYNTLFGAYLVGALYYNAELFVNDYPPDIKEKYGPLSAQNKRQALIVAIPLFIIGLGIVIWSTIRLKRNNDGILSFNAAFIHATLLILSAWLFDLVIFDWLIFVTFTPEFAILPGTEGMAGYDDYKFHLKEHLRAFPALVIVGAVLAFFISSGKE